MRDLPLVEKREVEHVNGYDCEASIGTEFRMAWQLTPSNVVGSIRQEHLAERAVTESVEPKSILCKENRHAKRRETKVRLTAAYNTVAWRRRYLFISIRGSEQ